MNNENINEKAFMRGELVEAFNKKAREEFEKYGGIDFLTQYVMSETLAPIQDYENVIKIIRDNYHAQISGELLIIGAYLTSEWSNSRNDFLEILNLMYDNMPIKEKAIIHYLNANHTYIRSGFKATEYYRSELYKTLDFNLNFVCNRCRIAEISPKDEAQKYYNDALKNVEEVISEEEIMKLKFEYFINPQSFINEFILGTHLSHFRYEEIQEKANLKDR